MSTGAGLRVSDVAERVGISYRQIDYWCRLGYLGDEQRGMGSGVARTFTEDDVAALRVIAAIYNLRSRSDAAMRDVVPSVLERVRSGDLGLVQLVPGLYLNLLEIGCAEDED